MPSPERPAGERIAKLLARAGVASRREVERMIAEGRVAIGGKVLDTPATIIPNLKGVTVDGKAVEQAEQARVFAFHKPSGLITAERDPKGRPTIYTALRNALPRNAPRLMPGGDPHPASAAARTSGGSGTGERSTRGDAPPAPFITRTRSSKKRFSDCTCRSSQSSLSAISVLEEADASSDAFGLSAITR